MSFLLVITTPLRVYQYQNIFSIHWVARQIVVQFVSMNNVFCLEYKTLYSKVFWDSFTDVYVSLFKRHYIYRILRIKGHQGLKTHFSLKAILFKHTFSIWRHFFKEKSATFKQISLLYSSVYKSYGCVITILFLSGKLIKIDLHLLEISFLPPEKIYYNFLLYLLTTEASARLNLMRTTPSFF